MREHEVEELENCILSVVLSYFLSTQMHISVGHFLFCLAQARVKIFSAGPLQSIVFFLSFFLKIWLFKCDKE